MNEYLQQFMTYWAQLRPRERIGVIFAAIILSLTLVYLVLWEPVFSESEQLQRSIEQNQELVQWMQQRAQEVKQMQASGAQIKNRGGSLLGTIDSTAKGGKLGDAMKRVEPDGGNRVRVWMELAPFDDLVRWLDLLQRSYGIELNSAVIDKDENNSGLVNARFVFTGAAS